MIFFLKILVVTLVLVVPPLAFLGAIFIGIAKILWAEFLLKISKDLKKFNLL